MTPATADETRRSYDAVAGSYGRLLPDLTAETALDRAVLAAFVELVDLRQGLVAEVGCGTGRVTAHLAQQGLPVVGLDLSPGMVAVARNAHPGVAFAVGDLCALPVRSSSLGALLAWYSIIHLPPGRLAEAVAELARVTRPGAPVLLAFQSGSGERVDREISYGLPAPLTYYRHEVEQVVDELTTAGFVLHATVRREAALDFETTPQAALLAHRC